MISLQASNIVTAIEYGEPGLRYQSGGMSAELRAISNLLKEGLEGLRAWIQLYALIPEPQSGETAIRELQRLGDFFAASYAQLMNYLQRVPSPKDLSTAIEIERVINRLLREELPKETFYEMIPGFGWTWAEKIDPRQNTQWTIEMIEHFLQRIKPISWQRARDLIAEAILRLP